MTSSQNPPGIPSPARLEGWLAGHLAEPCELTDIQLILGGRSNLTYRLAISAASGDRMLVLRRPPLGHVLPTAHDMSREFRVLSALSGTQVPVAAPVAFCDDVEVIGAPFYVMEYVPGAVMRTKADTAILTRAQATDLSERLADMLAAIHGVDVAATGLGDLGRGAGYLRRQLDRWQRQWQLSASGEGPGYERLVARLTAALPAEGETTLVHGDFRLDNVLVTVAPEPRITAVVDWEMATLGDPRALPAGQDRRRRLRARRPGRPPTNSPRPRSPRRHTPRAPSMIAGTLGRFPSRTARDHGTTRSAGISSGSWHRRLTRRS